jgi:hypothetical protein
MRGGKKMIISIDLTEQIPKDVSIRKYSSSYEKILSDVVDNLEKHSEIK